MISGKGCDGIGLCGFCYFCLLLRYLEKFGLLYVVGGRLLDRSVVLILVVVVICWCYCLYWIVSRLFISNSSGIIEVNLN